MLVRYGIDSKEKSVPILIKARKLMKEQNLSKWDAMDKVVEEEKKEGKLNFFRDTTICDSTCYNSDSYHFIQKENHGLMFEIFKIT